MLRRWLRGRVSNYLPVSRNLCDAATLAPGSCRMASNLNFMKSVSWPQLRARLPPRVISVPIPAIKMRSADDVNFRAAVGLPMSVPSD